MTTDSETTEQYLNFVRNRFLIYVLVFLCHVTTNLEGSQIRLQSRTGLIFFRLAVLIINMTGLARPVRIITSTIVIIFRDNIYSVIPHGRQ